MQSFLHIKDISKYDQNKTISWNLPFSFLMHKKWLIKMIIRRGTEQRLGKTEGFVKYVGSIRNHSHLRQFCIKKYIQNIYQKNIFSFSLKYFQVFKMSVCFTDDQENVRQGPISAGGVRVDIKSWYDWLADWNMSKTKDEQTFMYAQWSSLGAGAQTYGGSRMCFKMLIKCCVLLLLLLLLSFCFVL